MSLSIAQLEEARRALDAPLDIEDDRVLHERREVLLGDEMGGLVVRPSFLDERHEERADQSGHAHVGILLTQAFRDRPHHQRLTTTHVTCSKHAFNARHIIV